MISVYSGLLFVCAVVVVENYCVQAILCALVIYEGDNAIDLQRHLYM